jgi:hypothetical protein
MAKRDFIKLLLPCAIFAASALMALTMVVLMDQLSRDNGHQQKFKTFVANVQSGKWQLTQDRWLVGMQEEHDLNESYRKADANVCNFCWMMFWIISVGIVLQLVAVYSVRRRLNKLDASREEPTIKH